MRRLFGIGIIIGVALQLSAQGPRVVESLNFGWRFHLGDVQGAGATAFKDSTWRVVDLPHDFQIEQPWVGVDSDDGASVSARSRLLGRGFKEMGKGWYRYHLTPADSLKSRRLLLDFGGIMYVGDVYLNGERVGGTDYGYVGFEIDVTGKMKFDKDNVIAVRADTREPGNSRWYTGGGLFRGVKLIATDREVYFARHPLYITTRDNRYVTITAEVVSRGRDKKMPVTIKITGPDGRTAYEGKAEVIRATPTRTVEQQLAEIEIADPQVWDTEHPNLYTVEVTLFNEKGVAVDSYKDYFGFRTVEFTVDHGLLLNGKKVLLKGYANHHTLGALGAAAYPRAIEKRILLMKAFGMNHIRTSHNPYSREFIELCDRNGILVVDELYDKWTRQHTGGRVPFEQLWQTDVPEFIKRDRNSPSVILWSLGNELQQDPNQPFNDFGVTMYRLMRTLVNRYDSTRLTTVAMHPRYRSWETDSLPANLALVTDIQSYNYRYMYFPGDGRRFPWMRFYQSEASVSAMGQNFFEMNLERVIGLAYWGAIDYLGESQGWPAKGWGQGVFYIDLTPKPKAYYMKSFYSPDEPLVHIATLLRPSDPAPNGVQAGTDVLSDHWNGTEGQKFSIIVYTNADEVELLLNGKSLGTQPNDKHNAKMRNQIHWNDIAYVPGVLEAVARTEGKVVARHKIETTGEPVKLVAQPDKTPGWLADGTDLQHVRIATVDKKGREVPTAQGEVTFKVEGPADIVGVVNGDINSNEMMVGNSRSLYNGSCTVILRSRRQSGTVVLTASMPNVKPVQLTMKTETYIH